MDVISQKLHAAFEGECHYHVCGHHDAAHLLVFLHGIPTNGLIWRKIMPHMPRSIRSVAPDLLGMGQSKPKASKQLNDFTLDKHIAWIERFLLKQPQATWTFVMHGWGSVIGSDLARRYADRVKGLAYFESHLRPTVDPSMLSLPMRELSYMLQHTEDLEVQILEKNILIEKWLPKLMMGPVEEEVMALYQQPFAQPSDRTVLLQYIFDVPLGYRQTSVVDCIAAYETFLNESTVPKCLMYGLPGMLTTIDTVRWAKAHLPNLTLKDLGEAHHCAQETNPKMFTDHLLNWLHLLPDFLDDKH